MATTIRYALTVALAVSAAPALADHGTTATGQDDPMTEESNASMEYGTSSSAEASTSTAPQVEGTRVAASYDFTTPSVEPALGESPLNRQMDFGGE